MSMRDGVLSLIHDCVWEMYGDFGVTRGLFRKASVMCVMLASTLALTAGTVEVTGVTARQRYPWNGKVDVAVTLEGASNEVAWTECRFAATNGATQTALKVASVTRVGEDSGSGTTWTRRFVWDATADVGEVQIADVALTVEAEYVGGVQLWENGPYWAEFNVGATKPEEFGYYFWWGDTVGYKRVENRWDAADGSRIGFTFESTNCPTYGKSVATLKSEGWVDSVGNLAAEHDAATAHLGAPWRMPTDAEIDALVKNCTTTWTVSNGVPGRLVTGKGAFASRSVFLPAAGRGYGSALDDSGSLGHYWSSTPPLDSSDYARYLYFTSVDFRRSYNYRCRGQMVRPLRGFAP
ncbi:MAG: hypothetical protein ACI4RA_04945 [Kiritimatiellia bacterium]